MTTEALQMTPEQHDALALEVVKRQRLRFYTENLMSNPPQVRTTVTMTSDELVEFARRYRAALAEKMEPVVVTYEYGTDREEPLYSLEDWK